MLLIVLVFWGEHVSNGVPNILTDIAAYHQISPILVWSIITAGTLTVNQVLGATQLTPAKYGIIVECRTTWGLPHQPCKNPQVSCLHYYQHDLCISIHSSMSAYRGNKLTTTVLIILILQVKLVNNRFPNIPMVTTAHHQITPILFGSLITSGILT